MGSDTMNTLPPGFELESPALPAGFEFENVPQPPEGFQLEGVLVNDRPRLDEAGLQGNESPNAHAIGPFGWPLEVIEQGATKLGNFVLDPRYGILNKVLQGLGRTGFATERMEFGSPEYAQGQPTPIKPLFGAGQPIVTGQFADEDVDPVNRMTGNLLRGFTTPGSALTLGAGTVLKAPKVMATVFGGPMVDQAPETTAQMGTKVGEYVGTPPEQRTEQLGQETADAVLNEAVNKLMLGGLAQGAKFAWDNRPITPEVLPPLREAPPFQPLDRRLGNNTYIDADVTGQRLLTEGQKQIGFPSMAEALAKVGESLPKQEGGDAASLAAGAKMIPVEGQSSGGKSGGPISEDGNSIASTLGLRFDGRQEMIPGQPKDVYTKLDPKNPYTVYVEPGASVETVKARMGKKESGSTKEQDGMPIEDRGSQGGNLSSFGFLDPAFWKQQLGIGHEAKADAVQLYNRIRNKLGEKSAGWEMLNTPEFKAYMQGVRTPSEVEKWVGENVKPIETVSIQPLEQITSQISEPLIDTGKDVAPPKVETFQSARFGPKGVFYGNELVKDPQTTKIDLPKQGSKIRYIEGTENEGTGSDAPVADAVDMGLIKLPKDIQELLDTHELGDLTWDTDLAGLIALKREGVEVAHFPNVHNPQQIVSVDLREFDEVRALKELKGNLTPKVKPQPVVPMLHAGQQVKPSMVTGKIPEKLSQLMRAYDLPENASYGEVVKAHRERAKTLHPDKGGSADAMAHENAMFDAIEDKMIKQVVRGQREMEMGLVPAADKAIVELKDAIEAKRAGKETDKYARADAHTLEKWQLALQNAVRPFKAKGITIRPGSNETGAINMGVIKDVVSLAAAPVKSAGQAVRWYSEPLVERLGRMGGPVSKMVSEAGGQIISRQKMYYGRITPLIDPAKKAMGRPNAANMWMRKLHRYNDRAAVNNMFGQNEGTVPVNPAASRETALLNRANLAVGHLATLANPQFVPSNKLQRMLTSYGVDVVRRGAGPAWEAWTKGVADANGVTLASVQAFFRRWKAEMDEPTSDVAALNSINQDFTRFYPKSVTHIKPGVAWHEVIVADPFAYLEGAAQRTATAVAFREVFPAGSRMLQNTRKLVQAELRTDTQGTEFDNLIRALQGHPTDTFVSTLTAPDSWSGGGMRMLSQVVGTPLKSLMLTGNAATNIGEVVVGGPSIFLGYRNVLPAMLKLPWGWNQIYLNGQGNRALQNWAYDPSSPVRSIARAGSSTIRAVSFQQVLNELQEAQAAITARQVTDQIRNGTLPPSQNENIVAVARFMSMTEAQARRMLAGDRALLDQFDRSASSMLTGGHVSMAERSRAGTSRAFNELFWFHSYPQMTLNQVRKVMENLSDDVQNGNTAQAKANAKLLGRLIAGRTMQGAITMGVFALVFGGLFGLDVKKKEAKDQLGKFLLDAFLGGLGGPAAIGKRILEQGGDSKTLAANVAAISTPVSAASDIYDLSMGNGKYEGRGSFERIGMFLESKTPAAKMFQTGMALYGLSEGDPKLDVAKKAFYRWRRDEKGWKTSTSEGDLEEDKVFRAEMRRVVEKLQAGGDWQTELKKVSDTSRAGKSLFARTLLRDQNGKGLSEEDLASLRKRIGDEAVNLLQTNDSMIRQIARELGVNDGKVDNLNRTNQGLAVDALSQGKRIERLASSMPVDVSEWLRKNDLHLTDVSPEQRLAGRKELIPTTDYGRLETVVSQQYQEAIRRLMLSPSFDGRSKKDKQERLNEALTQAEQRAKRLSR